MEKIIMVLFAVTFVAIVMTPFSGSSDSTDHPNTLAEIPVPQDFNWTRVDSISEVRFPEGYRSWTHIKSAVNKTSGYHHIYANALAMEGYRTGKFPNGSVIVVDFLEMIDNETSMDEGKRRYLDVMVKDTMQYATTGGWGFGEFDGSSKSIRRITLEKSHSACYTCHTQREANDFVFSQYRD